MTPICQMKDLPLGGSTTCRRESNYIDIQTYCELFHQTNHKTVKHVTHKTNRSIDKGHKTYNITLTTSQVQEEIKQSKNNNSQGPYKLNLNIRHLKHICPLGHAFHMSMFKTTLNYNIIPHTWKWDNIVPIPKPNKDTRKEHLIQAHPYPSSQ